VAAARKDQRVVTGDCRYRFFERRTARTRLLSPFILLDEIPGRKRGHLIGPFDDPITILDLDTSVSIQVQAKAAARQGVPGEARPTDAQYGGARRRSPCNNTTTRNSKLRGSTAGQR
jgi:hypothetical protein